VGHCHRRAALLGRFTLICKSLDHPAVWTPPAEYLPEARAQDFRRDECASGLQSLATMEAYAERNSGYFLAPFWMTTRPHLRGGNDVPAMQT